MHVTLGSPQGDSCLSWRDGSNIHPWRHQIPADLAELLLVSSPSRVCDSVSWHTKKSPEFHSLSLLHYIRTVLSFLCLAESIAIAQMLSPVLTCWTLNHRVQSALMPSKDQWDAFRIHVRACSLCSGNWGVTWRRLYNEPCSMIWNRAKFPNFLSLDLHILLTRAQYHTEVLVKCTSSIQLENNSFLKNTMPKVPAFSIIV